MIAAGLALTALGCAALLVFERTSAPWRVPAKLAASTGFLLVAIGGGIESPYGWWVLMGLSLSWLGDAALLGGSDRAFLAGLGAFLLAHVAYVIAFVGLPPEASPPAVVFGACWVVAGLAVGRWLVPRAPRAMRLPVVAYIAVISAMVAVSWGAGIAAADPRIPLGAGAFAVSDLAVARDQFVAPGWKNRLWGLPLYYLGQTLLALTTG